MSHTIVGGNADRPNNIHAFDTITNVGTSAALEIDGTRITVIQVITGGQVTHAMQGSLDGTNWADLETAKTKDVGNHIDNYDGYCLRYLRLNVTASAADRTITATVCCDS